MHLGGLFAALAPVFFVLLLGFLAGKRHSFDANQAAGLTKLALGFALPASLFVGMAGFSRATLVSQWKLALCLTLVHPGLLIAAYLMFRYILHFQNTRSLIFALTLATSATPVFGVAVLSPLLGPTSIGAVGLVAVGINTVIPIGVILLDIDAGRRDAQPSKPEDSHPAEHASLIRGIKSGFSSPLLWAPILGAAVAISGHTLPATLKSSLLFIGSATSGVAVFAVGLILAAHRVTLSRAVLLGSLARVSIQSLLLLALVQLFHIQSPFVRETLICCSFPPATTVTLLAMRYKAAESEASSMLLLSTMLLAVTIPLILGLGQ